MNELAAETSPYLRQHAANPVHWRPWGKSTLQLAQRQDKPILLSIGYAACHWCHVMAHESFENDQIAAVMNEFFIAVKVDREERPDIDTIYQTALAMFGQQGGWPLTMFCTPHGYPFWGGTYFPPEPRHGHAGFPQLLRHVAALYAAQKDKVTQNVEAITRGLTQLSASHPAEKTLPADFHLQTAEKLRAVIDPVYGGLGDAPKFPQPSLLAMLWCAQNPSATPPALAYPHRQAVLLTLDRMAQGGLYDHLAGGFARYAVDRAWLIPHFEKMLYDNAQLVELYTAAWQATASPLYAQRVEQTITWLLRDMVAEPAGAFTASYDADSEGEEGRYYVWQKAEITAALGPQAQLFNHHYDVTPAGNWENKTILNRSARPDLADPATEAHLQQCRQTLLEIRAGRVPPTRDDKLLADWNGIMIAALIQASFAFDRPDWLAAAARAFDFVTGDMHHQGQLRHSWCDGQLKHTAMLDDYANMARAALLLYEQTATQSALDHATAWVETVARDYADPAGGFFLTAAHADDVIVRTKTAADNATPPGNATMVETLARLFYLTGEDRHRSCAEAILAAFAGAIERQPTGHTALLNARQFLHRAIQIVIVGDHPDTHALLQVIRTTNIPHRILLQIQPDQPLPQNHPAAGKGRHNDRPTAYLCRAQTCSPPITDPADLAAQLATS